MAAPLRKTDPEPRSYRERIRELVEADRVGGARKLLAEALERGDHGEDLSGWERVLAPAKARPNPGVELDFDRTPEVTWLREESGPYRGQWVALLGSELLAHSPSLDEVFAALERDKPKRRPLLHYVEA